MHNIIKTANSRRTDLLIRLMRGIGFTGVVFGIIFIGACSKDPANMQASGADKSQAVPVMAACVEQKTAPVELSGFGTVEEYSGVSIKAQVTGTLTAVHFTEGQTVKNGDLLLSIDPRPFDAALKLAQANLAKDAVQLKNAEKEVSRQDELLKKGFASQNDFDNAQTSAESLRAAVEADKASVENAMLQLEYCSIRSPIDGVVGKLAVHQGNLIKANDVTVVTVNQIVPIYVSFSFRQENLPQIRKYMSKGRLEVVAVPAGEKRDDGRGYLSFIDNCVDAATGTIHLRATFPNEDKSLWPGQFVKVALILTNEPNAIVIPSQAVQTGQNGQFVYVVKSDRTVETRPITTRRITGSQTVVDGLQAGESVVTDGQLRLVPGAAVQVKNPTVTQAAAQ